MTGERNADGDSSETAAESDHRYEFEAGERPSITIVLAVADVTNTPVMDLASLNESVDPEALDTLVRAGHGTRLRVEFTYNGCDLRVTNDALEVNHRPSPTRRPQ